MIRYKFWLDLLFNIAIDNGLILKAKCQTHYATLNCRFSQFFNWCLIYTESTSNEVMEISNVSFSFNWNQKRERKNYGKFVIGNSNLSLKDETTAINSRNSIKSWKIAKKHQENSTANSKVNAHRNIKPYRVNTESVAMKKKEEN